MNVGALLELAFDRGSAFLHHDADRAAALASHAASNARAHMRRVEEARRAELAKAEEEQSMMGGVVVAAPSPLAGHASSFPPAPGNDAAATDSVSSTAVQLGIVLPAAAASHADASAGVAVAAVSATGTPGGGERGPIQLEVVGAELLSKLQFYSSRGPRWAHFSPPAETALPTPPAAIAALSPHPPLSSPPPPHAPPRPSSAQQLLQWGGVLGGLSGVHTRPLGGMSGGLGSVVASACGPAADAEEEDASAAAEHSQHMAARRALRRRMRRAEELDRRKMQHASRVAEFQASKAAKQREQSEAQERNASQQEDSQSLAARLLAANALAAANAGPKPPSSLELLTEAAKNLDFRRVFGVHFPLLPFERSLLRDRWLAFRDAQRRGVEEIRAQLLRTRIKAVREEMREERRIREIVARGGNPDEEPRDPDAIQLQESDAFEAMVEARARESLPEVETLLVALPVPVDIVAKLSAPTASAGTADASTGAAGASPSGAAAQTTSTTSTTAASIPAASAASPAAADGSAAPPEPALPSPHPKSLLPFSMQGDPNLVGEPALSARASLRSHPRVVRLMDLFWRAFAERDSKHGLVKREYIDVHIRMQRALLRDANNNPARIQALKEKQDKLEREKRKARNQSASEGVMAGLNPLTNNTAATSDGTAPEQTPRHERTSSTASNHASPLMTARTGSATAAARRGSAGPGERPNSRSARGSIEMRAATPTASSADPSSSTMTTATAAPSLAPSLSTPALAPLQSIPSILRPDPVSLPHSLFDIVEAEKLALRDWVRDTTRSRGNSSGLKARAFQDSLFELVDLWTETTNVEEYVDFLQGLYQRITKQAPSIAASGASALQSKPGLPSRVGLAAGASYARWKPLREIPFEGWGVEDIWARFVEREKSKESARIKSLLLAKAARDRGEHARAQAAARHAAKLAASQAAGSNGDEDTEHGGGFDFDENFSEGGSEWDDFAAGYSDDEAAAPSSTEKSDGAAARKRRGSSMGGSIGAHARSVSHSSTKSTSMPSAAAGSSNATALTAATTAGVASPTDSPSSSQKKKPSSRPRAGKATRVKRKHALTAKEKAAAAAAQAAAATEGWRTITVSDGQGGTYMVQVPLHELASSNSQSTLDSTAAGTFVAGEASSVPGDGSSSPTAGPSSDSLAIPEEDEAFEWVAEYVPLGRDPLTGEMIYAKRMKRVPIGEGEADAVHGGRRRGADGSVLSPGSNSRRAMRARDGSASPAPADMLRFDAMGNMILRPSRTPSRSPSGAASPAGSKPGTPALSRSPSGSRLLPSSPLPPAARGPGARWASEVIDEAREGVQYPPPPPPYVRPSVVHGGLYGSASNASGAGSSHASSNEAITVVLDDSDTDATPPGAADAQSPSASSRSLAARLTEATEPGSAPDASAVVTTAASAPNEKADKHAASRRGGPQRIQRHHVASRDNVGIAAKAQAKAARRAAKAARKAEKAAAEEVAVSQAATGGTDGSETAARVEPSTTPIVPAKKEETPEERAARLVAEEESAALAFVAAAAAPPEEVAPPPVLDALSLPHRRKVAESRSLWIARLKESHGYDPALGTIEVRHPETGQMQLVDFNPDDDKWSKDLERGRWLAARGIEVDNEVAPPPPPPVQPNDDTHDDNEIHYSSGEGDETEEHDDEFAERGWDASGSVETADDAAASNAATAPRGKRRPSIYNAHSSPRAPTDPRLQAELQRLGLAGLAQQEDVERAYNSDEEVGYDHEEQMELLAHQKERRAMKRAKRAARALARAEAAKAAQELNERVAEAAARAAEAASADMRAADLVFGHVAREMALKTWSKASAPGARMHRRSGSIVMASAATAGAEQLYEVTPLAQRSFTDRRGSGTGPILGAAPSATALPLRGRRTNPLARALAPAVEALHEEVAAQVDEQGDEASADSSRGASILIDPSLLQGTAKDYKHVAGLRKFQTPRQPFRKYSALFAPAAVTSLPPSGRRASGGGAQGGASIDPILALQQFQQQLAAANSIALPAQAQDAGHAKPAEGAGGEDSDDNDSSDSDSSSVSSDPAAATVAVDPAVVASSDLHHPQDDPRVPFDLATHPLHWSRTKADVDADASEKSRAEEEQRTKEATEVRRAEEQLRRQQMGMAQRKLSISPPRPQRRLSAATPPIDAALLSIGAGATSTGARSPPVGRRPSSTSPTKLLGAGSYTPDLTQALPSTAHLNVPRRASGSVPASDAPKLHSGRASPSIAQRTFPDRKASLTLGVTGMRSGCVSVEPSVSSPRSHGWSALDETLSSIVEGAVQQDPSALLVPVTDAARAAAIREEDAADEAWAEEMERRNAVQVQAARAMEAGRTFHVSRSGSPTDNGSGGEDDDVSSELSEHSSDTTSDESDWIPPTRLQRMLAAAQAKAHAETAAGGASLTHHRAFLQSHSRAVPVPRSNVPSSLYADAPVRVSHRSAAPSSRPLGPAGASLPRQNIRFPSVDLGSVNAAAVHGAPTTVSQSWSRQLGQGILSPPRHGAAAAAGAHTSLAHVAEAKESEGARDAEDIGGWKSHEASRAPSRNYSIRAPTPPNSQRPQQPQLPVTQRPAPAVELPVAAEAKELELSSAPRPVPPAPSADDSAHHSFRTSWDVLGAASVSLRRRDWMGRSYDALRSARAGGNVMASGSQTARAASSSSHQQSGAQSGSVTARGPSAVAGTGIPVRTLQLRAGSAASMASSTGGVALLDEELLLARMRKLARISALKKSKLAATQHHQHHAFSHTAGDGFSLPLYTPPVSLGGGSSVFTFSRADGPSSGSSTLRSRPQRSTLGSAGAAVMAESSLSPRERRQVDTYARIMQQRDAVLAERLALEAHFRIDPLQQQADSAVPAAHASHKSSHAASFSRVSGHALADWMGSSSAR